MKTIKRTEDMPYWASWMATDENKCTYVYSAKPILEKKLWWTLAKTKGGATNIKPYCKNWRKSLRKIVNKTTRKELKKEVAKLNNIIHFKNNIIQGLRFDTASKELVERTKQEKQIPALNSVITGLNSVLVKKSKEIEVYEQCYKRLMNINVQLTNALNSMDSENEV